jgi:uncharacterized membrane protein
VTTGRGFTVARLASQVGGGLIAGVACTVLVLELALRRLDGPQYVEVRQAEFDYFSWFIGGILVLTLAAVTMLAVLAGHTRSRTLAIVALTFLLVALAVSLAVNGPINVEQRGWNATAPPANWAAVRDRWQLAHVVRTVAILIALGFLSAVPPRPDDGCSAVTAKRSC